MKVTYHLNQNVSVEAEGANHKEIFASLSGLAEVFSVEACGLCKSKSIVPIVREVSGVKHYEFRCRDCGGRLSMGQQKTDNALYPRRTYHAQHPEVKAGKAKSGDRLPDFGWSRYVKPQD